MVIMMLVEKGMEIVFFNLEVLLLIFHAAKRKNYSKEAAILLVQDNFLPTKCQVAQLRYSRFINVHGRQGCNIPCDLFMEHLNRQLKSVIGNMGSNIQPITIANAARAIGVVHDICSVFEKELKSQEESGYHPKPSYQKDLQTILTVLADECILHEQGTRSYTSFKLKQGILDQYNEEETLSWLTEMIGSFTYCS